MRPAPVLLAVLLLAGCASPSAPPPASTPAAAAPPEEGPAPGAWKSLAADPTPRYEIALARSGSGVYTVAGLTASAVATTVVERYDLVTDAWSPAPAYPFATHHLAAAAVDDNGSVMAFGGWIGIGQSATDLAFRLDPGAPTWMPLPTMPRARGAHAAAVFEGHVWLLGGSGVDGALVAETDVYDPRNATWREGPKLPKPLDHLGAAVLSGKLYLVGGRALQFDTEDPSLWVLDAANATWIPLAPMPTKRAGFAIAAHQGRLWVLGGETQDGLLDVVESYDPATNAWRTETKMLHARTGNQATVFADRLVVFGGADPSGAPFSDAPEAFGPK